MELSPDDPNYDPFDLDGTVNAPTFPKQQVSIDPSAVELALQDRALGGVSWREVIDRDNQVRVLREYRAGDVAAQKALLAAKLPGIYGQQVATIAAITPIQVTVTFVSAQGQQLDSIEMTGGAGGGDSHETPAGGGETELVHPLPLKSVTFENS